MTVLARVVVVNWNGAHLLPACLNSLLRQDLESGDLDIVVVENASTDDSLALLERDYPQVQVVVTEKNLGFAGGVNAGLIDLDAEFVVLLNNDATFAPDAVRHLLTHLRAPKNARTGAVTAQVLLTERDALGNALINSTGNILTKTGAATDRDWLVAASTPARGAHLASEEVFGFCGGAAALRSSTLREVGMFDAELFLYYEDTDLSWRIRAHGWDIHYVPEAVAHHLHAASSDPSSARFRYFNTRNSLRVYVRHAPVHAVVKSFARQAVGCLRHAIRRDESQEVLRARSTGLVEALRALPRDLRVRRDVWSGRAASRRKIYRLGLNA